VGTTSVRKTLNLCSQILAPVLASNATTRSPSLGPSGGSSPMMYTRPAMTSGVDRQPYGAFQSRLLFGSLGSSENLSGRLVSVEDPVSSGPRQCSQSAANEE